MSSRKTVLIMLITGLVLSVCVTNVMGQNLIILSITTNGDVWLYDKDSIKQSSETVKVWDEIRYNGRDEERSKLIDSCKKYSELISTDHCNRLSYKKDLYEIDCKNGTYTIISVLLSDENGEVIYAATNSSKHWHHVVPNTVIEELKNHVCK